jgi:hypothetical protein
MIQATTISPATTTVAGDGREPLESLSRRFNCRASPNIACPLRAR